MFASFKWSKPRRLAAALVAEDALTNEQIGERCGVSRRALDKWIAHPDFKAEVDRILADTRAALLAKGITAKQNRLDALDDRHRRMQTVIAERAIAPEMQQIAGGRTGLLVHRERMLGAGRNAQRIDEYEVDTGLLSEMRATEKQAAQELGEWTEKHDIKTDVLIREYGGFDPSQV